jgi:hypothetical protein
VAATNTSTSSTSAAARWWLVGDTSAGQSALFLCSAAYFALDIAQLHMRGRFFASSKAQRVLLHHVLSIVGLLGCVWSGRDGPLVLVGLVLAETSSPPFHVVQLCRRSASRSSGWRALLVRSGASTWLRYLLRPLLSAALSMDLTLLHVLIFLLTRLMLLQLTAHAVMPFAALLSTKVVATALVLLSACQFLDLLPMLQSDTHEGSLWRQVQAELRTLQQDCAALDEGAAVAAAAAASAAPTSSNAHIAPISGSGSDDDSSSTGVNGHASSGRRRYPSSSSSSSGSPHRGGSGGGGRTTSGRSNSAAQVVPVESSTNACSSSSSPLAPQRLIATAAKKLLFRA